MLLILSVANFGVVGCESVFALVVINVGRLSVLVTKIRIEDIVLIINIANFSAVGRHGVFALVGIIVGRLNVFVAKIRIEEIAGYFELTIFVTH